MGLGWDPRLCISKQLPVMTRELVHDHRSHQALLWLKPLEGRAGQAVSDASVSLSGRLVLHRNWTLGQKTVLVHCIF